MEEQKVRQGRPERFAGLRHPSERNEWSSEEGEDEF